MAIVGGLDIHRRQITYDGAVALSDHPVRLPPLGHLNRADCGHDRVFRVVSWCFLVGEPPLRRA
jgi:hypothetical protein